MKLGHIKLSSFFYFCRIGVLHNSVEGSSFLWSYAPWRDCSNSFMALCWKQILPVDLALCSSLGCLQHLAGSLFSNCKCSSSSEAIKRSRSHDVVQVCTSSFQISLNLSSKDFSLGWRIPESRFSRIVLYFFSPKIRLIILLILYATLISTMFYLLILSRMLSLECFYIFPWIIIYGYWKFYDGY